MNAEEIRYTLIKQVSTMHEIATHYGAIPLDFNNDYELWEAVADAVRGVLMRRLEALEAGEVQKP